MVNTVHLLAWPGGNGHALMYIEQKNLSRYCAFPSKLKRAKNLLAAKVKET